MDTIGALYRDMHTLKGSAQLFGFNLISQVAHAMEAALEPMRRLKLQIPPALFDGLFKSIDLIDRILKKSAQAQREVTQPFDEEAKVVVPLLLSAAVGHFGADYTPLREQVSNLGEDRVSTEVTQIRSSKNSKTEENTPKRAEVAKPVAIKPSETTETPAPVALKSVKEAGPEESSDANSTVRINVSLLDKLMNLVGEMVLVRNQMLQYAQKHDVLEFLNLSQRLDVVTSELQGDVMKTRMQPIGTILSKFQRLVRDLAKDLKKQIEFIVHGAETDLDKTLLEAIKDPLTHIIRNSCDHSLEMPEERIKAGKPAMGRVTVSAFHEGGHVIIEISDNGRGLNLKRILEKALEKKIVTAEQASKLTDREVGLLIFAPGFSTAEKVTSVSGRGVGMDVVRTNLERIGGQVELSSDLGQGMTVRLRIPLTLAIVPALIVRAGGELFSIPQVKLAELVRVENSGSGQAIELLQGKPVYRLRGQLLSLIDLREVLAFKKQSESAQVSDCVNIVVLNGDGDHFGLIVDEIRDTADIVVKPLSNFLKKIQIYSGATIMGNGSVSLILDVAGIARRSQLFQKGRERAAQSESGFFWLSHYLPALS